jgi:hypothetical protein
MKPDSKIMVAIISAINAYLRIEEEAPSLSEVHTDQTPSSLNRK